MFRPVFHFRTGLALVVCSAIASLFLIAGAFPVGAQSERLRVVTTQLSPFVERAANDRADGFYFEIWDDVAQELDVEYDIIWADSFSEMLDQLEAGTADVAVAPLAPTAEREAVFDFTSAVITSGPQLGGHERTSTSVSLIRTLLGSGSLRVLFYAFIGLVILGHLIWLVERRDKDMSDFHESWPLGVLDGMWWAAVTVTTVGYGDMAPKSLRGRAVGVLAMLASLFLLGAFVSQATADLNRARTEPLATSLAELGQAEVGTVAGSSFEAYLIDEGVNVRGYDSQVEAFEAASDGTIDYVVANPFALRVNGGQYGLTGVGDVFYEEFETFGLQQGSPWREPINMALADLQVSGHVQRIVDRWLGDS